MTARAVARRVLQRVEEGAFATLALGGELERASAMSRPDRGLATELVYGVLRQRRRLDYALDHFAPRGLERLDARTLDILRLGAYQILFLRIPAHAAVDDAVRAVTRLRGTRLGGFVNALLRRLARQGEPPPPDPAGGVAHLAVVHSAPDWLVERALGLFGPAEAPDFLAALNATPPVWLRANTLRAPAGTVLERLHQERPELAVARSRLLEEALRVEGAGDLFATRCYGDGLFSSQDLGAQLIGRLLAPAAGEKLLDGCAGVGGKSMHLAALSAGAATIDAADRSPRKLELCNDQARRLGVSSVRTVLADLTDASAPLATAYDGVLLDAPCSGLGVLRRHPEAKWRAAGPTPELLALQRALLEAMARRVAPGGRLVYSVCTFTDEEGPRQTASFLAAHGDFSVERASEPPLGPLVDPAGALRTWPHRHDADAFYAVRLRRKASAAA